MPDGLESLIQVFKSVVHKKHSASLRTYLEFLAERRQDTDKIKSKLQQIAGTAGEPDETHKKSQPKLITESTLKKASIAKSSSVSDYLQSL
jgi:hypothetical protein